MKTLILFAALATAIASPALARPAHQSDNGTDHEDHIGKALEYARDIRF